MIANIIFVLYLSSNCVSFFQNARERGVVLQASNPSTAGGRREDLEPPGLQGEGRRIWCFRPM